MHMGPQIKQAVWRVFTDYALLNQLPYWCILMDKIDILYDVVGGDLLVVQSAFHFSSVKESRKEGACAVVLAEHNHTLPIGGVLHYTQYLYTVLSHTCMYTVLAHGSRSLYSTHSIPCTDVLYVVSVVVSI